MIWFPQEPGDGSWLRIRRQISSGASSGSAGCCTSRRCRRAGRCRRLPLSANCSDTPARFSEWRRNFHEGVVVTVADRTHGLRDLVVRQSIREPDRGVGLRLNRWTQHPRLRRVSSGGHRTGYGRSLDARRCGRRAFPVCRDRTSGCSGTRSPTACSLAKPVSQ